MGPLNCMIPMVKSVKLTLLSNQLLITMFTLIPKSTFHFHNSPVVTSLILVPSNSFFLQLMLLMLSLDVFLFSVPLQPTVLLLLALLPQHQQEHLPQPPLPLLPDQTPQLLQDPDLVSLFVNVQVSLADLYTPTTTTSHPTLLVTSFMMILTAVPTLSTFLSLSLFLLMTMMEFQLISHPLHLCSPPSPLDLQPFSQHSHHCSPHLLPSSLLSRPLTEAPPVMQVL